MQEQEGSWNLVCCRGMVSYRRMLKGGKISFANQREISVAGRVNGLCRKLTFSGLALHPEDSKRKQEAQSNHSITSLPLPPLSQLMIFALR